MFIFASIWVYKCEKDSLVGIAWWEGKSLEDIWIFQELFHGLGQCLKQKNNCLINDFHDNSLLFSLQVKNLINVKCVESRSRSHPT